MANPAVVVRVQSLEDAKNGKGFIDDLKPEELSEKLTEAESLTVGILEKGTANGKTSTMFILKMPDGKYSMVQLTANMLDMIHSAVKGAKERFGDV